MARCAVMADLDRYEEKQMAYAKSLKLEEADDYSVLWDIIGSAENFLNDVELGLNDDEHSIKLEYYEDKGLSIFHDLYKIQNDLKIFVDTYADFIKYDRKHK